jgi:FAD/FMN-containing dehydrogenase
MRSTVKSEKTLPSGLEDRLKEIVGAGNWISDPAEMAPFVTEERGLYFGRTPLALKPSTTQEVAAILALCHEARQPIVPQGGNTGLVGAGVPHAEGNEIVVSLSRLNRVREVDPANFTVTAEAGVVLADLRRTADAADRFFPLSLGAEGSCQIGGNLSTNAGGTDVLRYGTMRDLTLGLEVVLADGTIWNGLNHLRKDNTGYDLKHLFIGSEGTLGVITAAVLKLFPKPRDVATALVAVRDLPAVIELLTQARATSGDAVTGFEYMARRGVAFAVAHIPEVREPLEHAFDHYVLIELTSAAESSNLEQVLERLLETGLESGLVLDGVVAQSAAQRQALWHIREAIPEAQKAEGGSIKHDVSVPVSRVADFIEAAGVACTAALPGLRPVPFGHVGDGNIHFNLSQPEGMDKAEFLAQWARFNRIVHDIVAGMHGSISAEHGIGQLKRDELRHYAAPIKLDLMTRVKDALDPRGILNPGKVL